jgi:DNA-binding NarL/FixJ family response regulator
MSIDVVLAGDACSCVAPARAALAADPALHVVAEAHGRAEAARAIARIEPAVAVVDVGLLALSEFFLTGWGPVSRRTRVVVVGRDPDPGLARRLLAQGAAGYVPAAEIRSRLAATVRAAVNYGPRTWVAPDDGRAARA